MNIKGRFLEFISYKHLSKRKFQESIGVSNSYIQNISNGIGAEVLQRIKASYPELNTDWLMTGEGDMLKPIQNVSEISNSTIVGANVNGNGNNISNNDANNIAEWLSRYDAQKPRADRPFINCDREINLKTITLWISKIIVSNWQGEYPTSKARYSRKKPRKTLLLCRLYRCLGMMFSTP